MNVLKIFFNTCIKKYFQFRGRSNRKEYNIYYSIIFFLNIVCIIFIHVGFTYIEYFCRVINLMLIIPTVSLTFRRLHDFNISGWSYFLLNCLIFIVTFYLMIKDGSFKRDVPMSITTTVFCYSTLILQYLILMFRKGAPTANKYGEALVN
jgi:hypothetical protein